MREPAFAAFICLSAASVGAIALSMGGTDSRRTTVSASPRRTAGSLKLPAGSHTLKVLRGTRHIEVELKLRKML